MRVLVISDTHRNLTNVYKLLKDISDNIDVIIHCGDVVEDAEIIKSKYSNIKVYNVRGNCDYGSGVTDEEVFNIGNKKIFVTHGDMYGVNWNTDRLCYKGAELGADICLFGHTHIPVIEKYNGMIIMNPGSPSLPRGGSTYSYGIIKIENNVVTPVLRNI